MAQDGSFAVQPDEVMAASKQLDALAERVEQLMVTETPNLTPMASGTDEVSTRVAETLNQVHAQFAKSSDQGINEIREVAATMRAHTSNIVSADADFVR